MMAVVQRKEHWGHFSHICNIECGQPSGLKAHQRLQCFHLKIRLPFWAPHKADASSAQNVCHVGGLAQTSAYSYTWAPSFHWSEKFPHLDGRLRFTLPLGTKQSSNFLSAVLKRENWAKHNCSFAKEIQFKFLGRILEEKKNKSLKFVSEVKGHKVKGLSQLSLAKILAWDQEEGHWWEQGNWPVSVMSWGVVRN